MQQGDFLHGLVVQAHQVINHVDVARPIEDAVPAKNEVLDLHPVFVDWIIMLPGIETVLLLEFGAKGTRGLSF
ncbi:hypothetical protein SDC9_156833 [bioreactor metagenome]|uniref:Uncharacterized protein n=1 Tax=bioreactor metagenome TaxID=1076179 RepID=A0A645F7P1_9ZZZZ